MTQEDFFSGSVSLGQNHGGLNTRAPLSFIIEQAIFVKVLSSTRNVMAVLFLLLWKVFDPPPPCALLT